MKHLMFLLLLGKLAGIVKIFITLFFLVSGFYNDNAKAHPKTKLKSFEDMLRKYGDILRTIPIGARSCVEKSICLLQQRPDLKQDAVEDAVHVYRLINQYNTNSNRYSRKNSTDLDMIFSILEVKNCDDIDCEIDATILNEGIDAAANGDTRKVTAIHTARKENTVCKIFDIVRNS